MFCLIYFIFRRCFEGPKSLIYIVTLLFFSSYTSARGRQGFSLVHICLEGLTRFGNSDLVFYANVSSKFHNKGKLIGFVQSEHKYRVKKRKIVG